MPGAPERNHRRCDVGANRLGVVAVTQPILVIGPQGDSGLHGPVLRHDLEDHFLFAGPVAEHGVSAAELHAARPDVRRASLAHGFKKRLHPVGTPRCRSTQGCGAKSGDSINQVFCDTISECTRGR